MGVLLGLLLLFVARHTPSVDADHCTDAGKYHDANGQCSYCPSGQVPNQARTECVNCAPGKYVETNPATTDGCFSCSQGMYAESAVTSACVNCPDNGGYYQGETEASAYECKLCAPGKVFVDRFSECLVCNQGKWSSGGDNNTECKTCGLGRSAETSAGPCTDCNEGKFQDLAESEVCGCSFCGKGRSFVSSTDACSACVAGTYQDADASSARASHARAVNGTRCAQRLCHLPKERLSLRQRLTVTETAISAALKRWISISSYCVQCEDGKFRAQMTHLMLFVQTASRQSYCWKRHH